MRKFEQVPLTPEEDINPSATTWKDGKCVKLDEGKYVTYYVLHTSEEKTEMRPTEDGEETVTVRVGMAVPVRLKKSALCKELQLAADEKEVYDAVLPLYVSDHMESYRAELAKSISDYDHSPAVNEFYYHGQSLWLSREDRIVIKDRFEREQAAGVEITHLVFRGYTIEVPPTDGLQLINAVAAYADQCFDVTQRHYKEVAQLETAEALISYDITEGYPEKLSL